MRNEEYLYINSIRERIIPDATKKHYGSYMSFDNAPLSPGCMACKTGGWLCIFIGTKCNCFCHHCPNHMVNGKVEIASAEGLIGAIEVENILSVLRKSFYKGVSFSGGEPLLYIDKLVDWALKIKITFPQVYMWNYTNGLLASEDNLQRLRKAGMDEIRFDLAADNYSSHVLDNLKKATEIMPNVGIEVPVILEQYNDLIDAIRYADSIGVKYLNLHDLFINEKLYKNGLGGYIRSYDRYSGIHRDIYNSSPLIYRIFRYIKDNHLKIVPNDCTLINMQLQTFGFRYQKIYNKYKSFEDYMNNIIRKCPEEILLLDNV